MAFSLFGEWHHPHHIEDEQAVAGELYALLTDARTIYRRDVVDRGKIYRRFVDDFVYGHRHISCPRAVCKNNHEMNLHIIQGLLDDCPGLVDQYFMSDVFSFRDCMDLKRLYDTEEFPQSIAAKMPGQNHSLVSFECNFTRHQLELLANCANTYDLFCVPEVTGQDMEYLFTCKPGFHIKVNNLRRIAILFDSLLENNLVQRNWQSVLWHSRLLIVRKGNGFVSHTSLSTALSASRKCPTSANEGIRKLVAALHKY